MELKAVIALTPGAVAAEDVAGQVVLVEAVPAAAAALLLRARVEADEDREDRAGEGALEVRRFALRGVRRRGRPGRGRRERIGLGRRFAAERGADRRAVRGEHERVGGAADGLEARFGVEGAVGRVRLVDGGGEQSVVVPRDAQGKERPGRAARRRELERLRAGDRRFGREEQRAAVRLGGDGVRGDRFAVWWRPVRKIPPEDGFFENVWRGFRENKNVK